MEKYSYQEIKEDIVDLVEETVEMGNTLEGGFSRAEIESWLGPLQLEAHQPASYLIKLLSIFSPRLKTLVRSLFTYLNPDFKRKKSI